MHYICSKLAEAMHSLGDKPCLQKREEAQAGISRQVQLRLQLSFQVGGSAQVAALKQAVAQGYHLSCMPGLRPCTQQGRCVLMLHADEHADGSALPAGKAEPCFACWQCLPCSDAGHDKRLDLGFRVDSNGWMI